MNSKSPLISIGVPTYNSEKTIGFTLESLLAQNYGNYELIISDNASTDATIEVVEKYKNRDSRIQYVQQPINIGANLNYSYVARTAKGEYFKWSSSSDWCAPEFLERCLNAFMACEDTVLVAPRTKLFCDSLENCEDYAFDIEIHGETPSIRLKQLYSSLSLNNAMNGLIRTNALRQTCLIEPYRGADMVLMGHLALLGKFRLLDDRLFYRRMEEATSTTLQNTEAVWRHHYPKRSIRILLQGSKRQLGRLRSVFSTSMSTVERLRALAYMLRIMYWERKSLMEDLQGIWFYISHRFYSIKK